MYNVNTTMIRPFGISTMVTNATHKIIATTKVIIEKEKEMQNKCSCVYYTEKHLVCPNFKIK